MDDDMLDEDLETGDAADPELEDEIEGAEEFEDELEDEDPEEIVDEPEADDVEADLDTILKDRIASGDDLDDEDEEVDDRSDGEVVEGVTAKREGEFTCTACFMIVHPRQFGRRDRLTCPVGDDDCPAIAVVRASES